MARQQMQKGPKNCKTPNSLTFFCKIYFFSWKFFIIFTISKMSER